MIDERTRKNLKDFTVLNEPQTRIYIMLNSTGKIKIGKSKDIYINVISHYLEVIAREMKS